MIPSLQKPKINRPNRRLLKGESQMLYKIKCALVAARNKTVDAILKVQIALLAIMVASTANAADTFNFDSLTKEGQTIDDVNAKIEGYSQTTFNMIKAAGVLVGLVFVFAGVIRLKKSQDPNGGVSPMQGLMLIFVGGLCAALPWLLMTSASTVQA